MNERRQLPARLAFGLLIPLLLWSAAATAQSVSSTLRGTITNGENEPVSDALVTARHDETSATRQALSDSRGRFMLNLLKPGTYTVRVEASGYLSLVREKIALPLQSTVVLDFDMTPALVEEVVVEATRPLIDPTTTAGGLSIGAEEMAELPLSGRQFTDLALLDASIVPVAPGTFYGEQTAVFSANGQGGRSNSFLVDGLDNNDATLGSRTRAQFSQQVIQEFRVMTDGYGPEFGRASGGVLNIITRSGGNELGGGLFLQGSEPRWNDVGEFVDGLPDEPDGADTLDRFQFGGYISGPIKRDRAFYFAAYEESRSDELVPFVGIQRDGTPGGRLVAPNVSRSTFAKINSVLGANHQLDLRLSYDEAEVFGVNVAGITTPEFGSSIDEDTFQVAASLTSALGPNWFHEVRVLASSSSTLQQANSDRPGVDRPSGIFGGNHLQLQDRTEDRFQLVDNLSWFRGKHAMKFGIDIERVSVDITAGFNDNGLFLYTTDDPYEPGDNGLGGIGAPGLDDDGDGTVDELADFDTFPLVYQLIQGKPTADFDTTLVAAFVQDEYRATPNLRLVYGLRYDLDTFELTDKFAIDGTKPNGGAPSDTDNVAPRFAFTWTPTPDMLIRGGAGMFYDKVVLGFPAISAITGQQVLGLAFVGPLNLPVNEEYVEQFGNQILKDAITSDPRFNIFLTTGDTLDTPYTVQANLGFEARVAKSSVLSFNAVRARGYHIPLLRDLNPVVDFILINNDPDRKFPLHRNDLLGSVASVETLGNSWYTALEAGFVRREGPLRFRASYVWSRAEDEGSDPLRGGISLPFDSDDIPGERARSDNDQRHRIVLSGTWDSPFWGLRVSPVVSWGSGIPFNVTVSEDHNGDGLRNDRPCTPIDDTAPCTGKNVATRLNRNTGEDTPLNLVNKIRRDEGLDPIDELDEPYFLQVDLRLSKSFQIRRTRLDGYLQVFNLFGRFNGGPVDGHVNSRTFGEPIGQLGPPRTVEMGFRLDF